LLQNIGIHDREHTIKISPCGLPLFIGGLHLNTSCIQRHKSPSCTKYIFTISLSIQSIEKIGGRGRSLARRNREGEGVYSG
jgi:hypothetical protein